MLAMDHHDSSSEEEVVVFRGWGKPRCKEKVEKKTGNGGVAVLVTKVVVPAKEEKVDRQESHDRDTRERKEALWRQCVASVKEEKLYFGAVTAAVVHESEAGRTGGESAESKVVLAAKTEEPPVKPSPLPPEAVKKSGLEDKLTKDGKAITTTGPKPRPFFEPPQFNYDGFERECIPSDKRFALVFPDDIEKRTKHKDLLMEHEVIGMWDDWFFDALYDISDADRGMACALWHEVVSDEKQVGRELQDLYATNTDDLAKWEFDYLDNDGETTRIEKELLTKDIFRGCERARAKYGHLGPTNVERWERWHLRHFRTLRSFMKHHHFDLSDVFAEEQRGSAEVDEKWGYLAAPSLEQWEALYLDKGGETSWIRLQLLKDESIFGGCDAAKGRYGYLVTDLERWEDQNLEAGPGGKLLFKEKHAKNDHLFEFCAEARSMFPEFACKYPHLIAQALRCWEDRYLERTESGRAQAKTKYRANTSIFQFCDEARTKYLYLMTEALQCWEERYLVKDNAGNLKIKGKWRSEGQRIFKYCGEAGEKYAYLTSTRLEDFKTRYLREDAEGGVSVRRPRSGWFEYDVFRYSELARAIYQSDVDPDYRASIWHRDVNLFMVAEEDAETEAIFAYRRENMNTARYLGLLERRDKERQDRLRNHHPVQFLEAPKTEVEKGLEHRRRSLTNNHSSRSVTTESYREGDDSHDPDWYHLEDSGEVSIVVSEH